MKHDPAADVVLPDRELVLAEAALEFLHMVAPDVENDPHCFHRLTLLGVVSRVGERLLFRLVWTGGAGRDTVGS
jgi:hypothetical protein